MPVQPSFGLRLEDQFRKLSQRFNIFMAKAFGPKRHIVAMVVVVAASAAALVAVLVWSGLYSSHLTQQKKAGTT